MADIHFPDAFTRFHEQNPWIYAAIVRHAYLLRDQGFTSVGMRYLIEHQRYSTEAREARRRRNIEFGLDNNYAKWYALLIMDEIEDLRGFFRVRHVEEPVETGQVAIEFE